jgi:alkylation response protein AidB-like acyl-CoA dehydrogenase
MWPMPAPTEENSVLLQLLDEIDDYGRTKLVPMYRDLENKSLFPEEAVKWLAEMGIFGLIIPGEYGGSGMGAVAAAYVARELAYWWPGLHLIWTAHNLAAEVIIQAGSEEQKSRLLLGMALGEIIGAFGLTEPGAGTDALSMSTKAPFDPHTGSFMLTGSKCFITNPKEASVIVVPARTGTGKKDISAFLIETGRGLKYDGITVIAEEKNCLKCSSFCRVEMNKVPVHESDLLGKPGQGFYAFMHSLAYGRLGIAAQAIGMAERISYEAMKHAHDRKMFGGTLWDKQVTKHAFAKARAELWVAWQGVVEAAHMCDAGKDFNEAASYVKYVATETADEVARSLTRRFGGMIALTVFDHMQRMNEAYLTTIYEGCNEVQLDIIAKHLEKEFKG